MLKENKFFFLGFLLFLLPSLFLLMQIETGDVIMYFQERRTEDWTYFFSIVTQFGEEIPYFIAFFLFLYFRNLREALFIGFTGAAVGIVGSLLKLYFSHPRPKLFYEKKGLFHTFDFPDWLHIHYGYTSFPSGHTMSGFALFAVIAFFLPKKKGFALLMLLFAIGVGFSRIYLFQHFLKDTVSGAFVGVLLAMSLVWSSNKLAPRLNFSLKKYFENTL